MFLSELLERPVPVDIEVSGLQLDSRAVQSGDLFFALAGGQTHGLKHAAEAVNAGAAAILFDPSQGGSELAAQISDVPCIAIKALNEKLGAIADRFYGKPSSKLDVIGITGTNGKTSCSHFLANALDDAAVIGTLGWGVPGLLNPITHTTPNALEVHRYLAELQKQGIKTVVMEASSHGLAQNRLQGVRFSAGLLTNISHDHLDYHGTMQAYLEAKLRLLECESLDFIAFNLDDDSIAQAMQNAAQGLRKIGFTLKPYQEKDILSVLDLDHSDRGISIKACFNDERFEIFAPVQGDFNVENLLASAAVLLGKGYGAAEVSERMKRIRPVPGRMEFVPGTRAVIDFAHTPDALAKALIGLRKRCEGLLWVVFGCGGDRDKDKRPKMGEIACRLADRVVLTDDNPRFESGDDIVQAILQGCDGSNVQVIRDRRQAIAYALEQADASDVVLIAGKGHECYQEIAGVKHRMSDFETVTVKVAKRMP